jgi:hypothetical protein
MIIYLYLKTHNKTGLRYLGKTTKNPFKYKGSGKDWMTHIHTHGYDVTTEILKECSTNEELSQWGRYYSKLWNIVNSQDDFGNKIWANRIPETGGGVGMPSDINSRLSTERWQDPEFRQRMTDIQNEPERKVINSMKLTELWSTSEFRERQLTSHRTEEYHNRTSILQKEAQNRPEVKAKVSGSNSYRYDHTIYDFFHEDNIIERCTQYELIKKYGLEQRNLNAVVRGKRRKCKGWSIIPGK